MTKIEEKVFGINGCQVHTLQAGNPEGQDVLLLHGMAFQAQTWHDLQTLSTLAEAGFHAVALDLPGFGKSPQCSMNPQEVLVAVIEQAGLKKPVLVGPSMGGRVSLEFALARPDLVGGLVLVGAVGVQENRKRLAEIKVPCLVVWGGMDTISPLENGKLLEHSIDNARLVIIEEAPHPCYLDNPDIWHHELLAFLKEQSG